MITLDSTAKQHGSISDTWSHTVGNGDNRILIVAVALHSSGKLVTGITYNDVSLTKLFEYVVGASYRACQLFYLVNPPVGTYDIKVTIDAGSIYKPHYASISFFGVDQDAPFRNNGHYARTSKKTVSLDVEDCGAGDLALAFLAFYKNETGIVTDAVGQTRRIESIDIDYDVTGYHPVSHLSTKDAVGDTTTLGWTFNTYANTLAAGVSIVPAEEEGDGFGNKFILKDDISTDWKANQPLPDEFVMSDEIDADLSQGALFKEGFKVSDEIDADHERLGSISNTVYIKDKIYVTFKSKSDEFLNNFSFSDTVSLEFSKPTRRKRIPINATGRRLSFKFENKEPNQSLQLEDVALYIRKHPWLGRDKNSIKCNATGHHLSIKIQNNNADEPMYISYIDTNIRKIEGR